MTRWTMRLRRGLAVLAGLWALGPPGTARAASLPEGTVVHGPFEIVVGVRRISTGTFPNIGGNPFAKREVSEYQVRWKGQPVTTADGNRRFWRVLRLAGAPRPALLLITTGFVLASEDPSGQLRLQPIRSDSAALAELQWLDGRDGRPAAPLEFGIEAVPDLQAGTLLQGGRWLRFGSRSVMEVSTLTLHAVEPWVPIVPGQPITSLSREGDVARAFSPSRGQYVLAASGIEYARTDQRQAHGLLVVDIALGTATELRVDRKRFRFAEPGEIDAAWITHHFTWQRDPATGRERLMPRERFAPWPWRVRWQQERHSAPQLSVPRIDGRFLAVVRKLAEAQAGTAATDTSAPWGAGFAITLAGCAIEARVFGADSNDPAESRVALWPASSPTGATVPTSPACEPALRKLTAAIDAELATGRYDTWLRLE